MDTIASDLRQFLLQNFLPGEDPDLLEPNTPLISGGILDSISTLKLVVFLEERYGVRLEAHEAGIDHLDTIQSIVSLVSRKRAAA
jgi:acyl carrier protein